MQTKPTSTIASAAFQLYKLFIHSPIWIHNYTQRLRYNMAVNKDSANLHQESSKMTLCLNKIRTSRLIHFPTSENSISCFANYNIYNTSMIGGHPLSHCNRVCIKVAPLIGLAIGIGQYCGSKTLSVIGFSIGSSYRLISNYVTVSTWRLWVKCYSECLYVAESLVCSGST